MRVLGEFLSLELWDSGFNVWLQGKCIGFVNSLRVQRWESKMWAGISRAGAFAADRSLSPREREEPSLNG